MMCGCENVHRSNHEAFAHLPCPADSREEAIVLNYRYAGKQLNYKLKIIVFSIYRHNYHHPSPGSNYHLLRLA
jgi:hypothetical protein